MAVQTQIQTRRGTAATWTSTNPTLAAGEIGFESDTGKIKIGTGSTAWNALAYTASSTAVTYLYNATASQTTFSGADANGLTLAYTVGSEQVYLNGVLQVRGSDYTATNGTSIVLTSGALVSDVLNVIAFSALALADTYTQAQADAKFYQLASASVAGKNAVINGGMDVWQRGTSLAVTAASTSFYSADRFQAYRAVSGATISRQTTSDTTNLPIIQYCARVSRDSGNTATDGIFFAQGFESANSYRYVGQSVTLSFYARKGANYSATSSALSVKLQTGTGTDQNIIIGLSGGPTNVIDQTATLTTTWQRFSYTGTVSSTATQIGVLFGFTPTGTAGAADYYETTGVQVELGSIATAFARAGGTIAGELAACKRYLPSLGANDYLVGLSNATNSSYFNYAFSTTARVAPTGLTVSGTWTLLNGALASGTVGTVQFGASGVNTGLIQTLTTIGSPTLTVGQGALLYSASGTILFTGCEL